MKRTYNPKRYENAYRITHRFPERSGSNNHFWKGGKTVLARAIRTCSAYKDWRRAVYIRANHTCAFHTCALCDCKKGGEEKVVLQCDHIKPLCILLDEFQIKTLEEALACKELWDVNNGRILCKSCHKTTPTYGLNLRYANNIA